MKNHFTHIDDISIAYRFTKENFFTRACENNIAKPVGVIIYKILDKNKERFCNFYYYAYIYTVIPRNFTYAPFQFWLTHAFLKPENSYEYIEIKKLGRLPSFIFHIFGIFLFLWLLINKIPGLKDEKLIPFILILFASLSLEQRIMASQMHSYAIGILSNVCALYGIFRARDYYIQSNKQIFITGFLLALSVAMQYQAILLILAGFFSIFIVHFNKNILKLQLNKFFILVVFFILGLLITGAIIIIRYQSGVNWNAGPNSEFVITSSNLIIRLSELFSLIIQESSYNIYSIASAIEFTSIKSANFFGIIILFFVFLGIVFLFKKRNLYDYKIFSYTIFTYLLIFLLFIFLGKLSFAPTRHFLFLLPIIIIFMGYGFLFIKFFINKKAFDVFIFSFFAIYGIISLYSFSSFENKRLDVNQVYNIPKLFYESGANQFLLDQFDIEPFFMSALSNSEISRYRPNPLCKDHINLILDQPASKFIIFWYSKRVILDNDGIPIGKAPYNGGPIASYYQKVIEDCYPGISITMNEVKIKKITDILLHHSSIEIDLSNRTKNGSNSLFLQTFQVELPTLISNK